MRTILLTSLLVICFVLSACSTTVFENTPTPTPEGTLNPYLISQATSTIAPSLMPTQTKTPLPTATPTPLTYKVLQNDDMGGIAYRFGVSVSALKTANPTVNPRAMGAGIILIIPATRIPTGMPSPTHVTPTPSLTINTMPVCYPWQDRGLWCFWLVKNAQTNGIENLTGKIILNTGNPDTQKVQTATSLLNILPAGQTFPLVAFFPDQPSGSFQVVGEITTAIPQPTGDKRYLPANILGQQVAMAADKKSVQVSGMVSLVGGNAIAQQVWVLTVAYTPDGQVAGLRKWEAAAALASGDTLPFDTMVYSLGPEIDHIECMVEARP